MKFMSPGRRLSPVNALAQGFNGLRHDVVRQVEIAKATYQKRCFAMVIIGMKGVYAHPEVIGKG